MPFGFPDTFTVQPLEPVADQPKWPQGTPPSFHNDENKKKEFGIALAKESVPFSAACSVCGDDTKAALWISTNWIADPIVIAAKDLYLKTVGANVTLLDKDQLAARLLQCAEEKITVGGREVYINEAKDRLGFLKLYSDVRGYTGKVDANNSTNNFNITKIKVEVVEPKPREPITTVIEHNKEPVLEKHPDAVPIKLKLVG